MTAPGPGDEAPDFELPGTGGRTYSLSSYRGQTVVLAFYPGDNTPVCTRQLRTYSRDLDRFEGVGAVVLGISPQGVDSHEEFAGRQGLLVPLLADADKSVGRAYGVVGPVGFYRRSLFVIDGTGIVRYAHRAAAGLTFRSVDEIVAAVRAAGTAPAS